MNVDQAKRLKVLEQGNLQLKQIVANRDRDLPILKEVSSGKLASKGLHAERLCWMTHWQDEGAIFERRAVLHAPRVADHDGTQADPLQHGPSAQRSWGPTTRSRNHPPYELKANMVDGTNILRWSPA